MIPADLPSWLINPRREPLVMGILNVTPDSFSDGGRYAEPCDAIAAARAMAASGADWIDIGGESTRPGSARVDAAEQIRRVTPLLRALRANPIDAVLSIDTTLAAVASAAMDMNVHVVNDISAGRDDPEMLPLVARRKAPVILMHMQGTPQTMQLAPAYRDVLGEVREFLCARLEAALDAGISPERILFDPGIGFGKTLHHNLQLLGGLRDISELGRPLVVGTSRKSFLSRITGEPSPARPFSTAASVAWSVANGAAVVRVHDVQAMSHVVRMIRAIQTPDDSPIQS